MKYKLIKQKALLQIFLVISLSFYSSISFAALNQPVPAEEDKQKLTYFDLIEQDLFPSVDAQDKVCCEITKTDSEFKGTSCVYTEPENCKLNVKQDKTACEQTNYCVPGVCILNNVCQDNVEKKLCEQRGGIFRIGKSSEISQCQIGCCSLPIGASLTTEAQCSNAIKNFPSLRLNEVFDKEVKDEATCVQRSKGTEEGCCVSADKCIFGTRAECSDGEFKLNTLCSYAELGCPVTAKHSTICYAGKVYWTDSSGNRENIYGTQYKNDGLIVPPQESCKLQYDVNGQIINDLNCGNCEYSAGSICDQVTEDFKTRLRERGNAELEINKIKNQCISLDCKTTKKSKEYDGKLINPWMDGRLRKNGESWCEYEGVTGNGLDLVGSRQYRHVCRNGVEVVEEAKPDRKEYCIQGEIPGELSGGEKSKLAARLVTNNWEVCGQSNKQEECTLELEYHEILNQCGGECNVLRGIGKDSELYECCTKQLCRKQSCEETLPNCYFNENVKLCAPNVPPGTLVRTNKGDNPQLDDEGNIFKYECKEIWAIEGPESFYDWNCAGNCKDENRGWCSEQNTVDAWNSYCRSLGDYGAYYNIEAKYFRGFDSGVPKGYENTEAYDWDGPFIPRNNPPSPTKKLFSEFAYANKPIDGGFYLVLLALDTIGSRIATGELDLDKGITAFSQDFEKWVLGTGVGVTVAELAMVALSESVSLFGISSETVVNAGVYEFFSSVFTQFGNWGVLGQALAGEFLVAASAVGAIILAIIGVYLLIDWILGLWVDQKEVTYTYKCLPWQPPRGGADCEKCNNYQLCDKYKCESLGKSCVLKNEGSPRQEACVYENKGDAVPPIIGPLPILPRTINDFNLIPPSSGLDGGYEFKQEIPSFTEVEIGIKVNERAQCKISRFSDRPYESDSGNQMTNFFGGNLYLLEHKMKIPVAFEGISQYQDRIEVEAGKVNIFYVKCVDVNDNKNERSYFIRFKVSEGPDITPPIIEEFSISNNAFIRYNLNQTSLTAYVNEPSQCKYSTVDQSYELMPNNMTCTQGKVNRNLYGCNTVLTIKPNQENTYYFRCKDKSNNTNRQSTVYNLKGTKQLKIVQTEPSGNVLTTDVTLTIATSEGAEEGKSTCFYSLTKAFSPDSIRFANTDAAQHTTLLSLQNEKDYLFYSWCRDRAGNEDNTTIKFHTTTPDLNITDASPNNKIIYDEKVELKITTKGGIKENGESDCRYDGAGLTTGINDYKITQGQETIHHKNITLGDGSYELLITCTDKYKADKKKINFEVDTAGTPKLIRLFKEGSLLNVMTDREAICHYSPTDKEFKFESGTLMVTTNNLLHSLQIANSKVYYVRCQDLNTKQISQVYTVYP